MEEADEKFKKVDESWKKAIEKEKDKIKETEGEEAIPPKPEFNFFVSSLALETLMALGDMENPITKNKSTNLKQAQYIIDTIDMLREKAKGNLTKEEDDFITGILSDLKMRYVSKIKQ